MGQSTIETLADKIQQALPPSLQALSADVRALIHESVQQQLLKLDLVPREEFDTQCAVLRRAEAKLVELEQVLKELEEKFYSKH